MRSTTSQGLAVLRRVRDFLAEHELDAEIGEVKKHAEVLAKLVDQLTVHVVEQDANDRGYRAAASDARDRARSLRLQFIRPVVRMSKALFADDETARAALRTPDQRDYEGLIAAALAMAQRAAEHKERFVAAGFRADFVERLTRAADSLRAALDEKFVFFGKRAAATAGQEDIMQRGRDIVRLIDSMVSVELEGTPDRLAQWRTLSRFVKVTRAEPVANEEQHQPTSPAATPTVAAPAAVTEPALAKAA